MAKDINTEILINARPERVWAILTNYESYPKWNPFIRSILGEVKVGNKINIRISSGSREMGFSPKVLSYTEHKVICWRGHFLIPGIFDGTHRFELIPTGDGCTLFKHSERFTGLLLPFMSRQLANTKQGFEAMNTRLKEESEKVE